MTATESMRSFAADCLVWACSAQNPSQKQVMLEVARYWASTAEAIDRRIEAGEAAALPDFKCKLN